ncbi:unnamed protein product [Blepharisma stoltei]|uniref:Right handed beta helix domain-containing protein n=1 Tax=Blepharisma stoltei TaxID=1481888 RepID=A0AAU9III5_9CILI|nr:unnamed protein product [Blepharisma stoltei]
MVTFSNPCSMYVDYNTTSTIRNGSKNYPYKTLAEALENPCDQFIEILLEPGLHIIDEDYFNIGSIAVSLIIRPASNDQLQHATLKITNSKFTMDFETLYWIYFQNIIFDRKAVAQPYEIQLSDVFNTATVCPINTFSNFISIGEYNWLFIYNTTFQNMEYNLKSIIFAQSGVLRLYNTTFQNIKAYDCGNLYGVIILRCDLNCYPNTFVYEKGTVELNNGFFSSLMDFASSFLLANYTGSIKFSNVNFLNSLSLCRGAALISDYCGTLISVDNCRGEFIFENCSFDTIYTWSMVSVYYDMDSITSNLALNDNYEWIIVPKMRIVNNTFNLIGSDILIFCYLFTYPLEIYIKDFYISNSLFLYSVFYEYSYWMDPDNMILINAENVLIDSSLFKYGFFFDHAWNINATLKGFRVNHIIKDLKLSNTVFPYFNSSALSIYDNGSVTTLLLIFSYEIHTFSVSNFMIDETLMAPSSSAFSVLYMLNIKNQALISNISIDFLHINSQFAPINIVNGNKIFCESITIKNTRNDDWAAGIALANIKSAHLNNINIENIYSSYQGGIYLKDCEDVLIENSIFYNATSDQIGGGIGINNLTHLFEIKNLTFFQNNQGSIIIFSQTSKDAIFYIKKCIFALNSRHQSGSAVAYVSVPSEQFFNNTVITENCSFYKNTDYPIYIQNNANYQDFGSIFMNNECVLYADGFSAQNNLFNGTIFYQNFLGDGLISIFDGSLNCINCYFSENSLLLIYLQNSAWANLESCAFFNNTADEGPLVLIFESLGSITFNNVSIVSNYAFYDPILHIQGSNILLKQFTLKDNILYNPGQSEIYIQNASFFRAEESLFISTKTTIETAIISSNSTLYFDNCEFRFIYASPNGLIFVNYGKLLFHNSKMTYIENSNIMTSSIFIYAMHQDIIELKNSVFSNSLHTGLGLVNTTRIIITDCSFLNGINTMFLEIVNYEYLSISNSLFYNNTSNLSAAALEITNQNETSVTKIENSKFINNSVASKGGAFLLDCCNAQILNSTFENNMALEGGAGYVRCMKNGLTNYFFRNIFSNNSAKIGASLCVEGNNIEESDNEYSENHAEYGDKLALHPVRLVKYEDLTLDNDTTLYYDGVCGLDYPLNFSFALIDINQQLVTGGFDGYSASLRPIFENSTINGVSAVNPIRGIIIFNNLTFLCAPGSEIRMNLTYFGSIDFWISNRNISISLNLTVILRTRNCINGEYRSNNQCIYCKEGQYSLSPDNNCNECPVNAYCYGGDLLAPKPGYWRGKTDSIRLYHCLNPNACEGGLKDANDSISLTGRCREGYQGNLCQACDYGFSSSGGNNCERCPSSQDNIIRLVGLGICTILVVTIVVYLTFITAYEPVSISSIFFKILLNYFQVISIIIKMKLPWPWYADSWLSYQSYPGDIPTHLLSIDCLLIDKSDKESYKSIYFLKMIIMVCLPAALGICIFIFWLIVAVIKNIYLSAVKNELITTLWILHFLILPTITNYMFSIFSCMDIYGELYLSSNLDIKCWDNMHSIYAFGVALPGILIWTAGIPLGIFLYLWKKRRHLYRLETMLRFGFIYNGYRKSKFYWEFVILIRKLLIIWIAIFFTNDAVETQAIVCFTVLFIFFYLQYKCYPFEYLELNTAELTSIFVELLTIYCGLYYMTNELSLGLEIFFFVLLVLSNAYFLWVWLKNISKKLILLILKKIQSLRKCFDVNNYKDYGKIEEKSKLIATKNLTELEIKDSASISLWAMKRIAKSAISEESNIGESHSQDQYP